MKVKIIILFVLVSFFVVINAINQQQIFHHPEFGNSSPPLSMGLNSAYAYPPSVGILSNSKNCMSCHLNNGLWKDDNKLIIDILDMDTKKSLKQLDGTFLIEVKRWEQKTVLTVIGHKMETSIAVPYRNAWIYIDPQTIGTHSLSKFAPDWDVNLPMACRVVGDKLPGYENAYITSLPMTIQPLNNAKNAELQLQVMLTKGESVKGKPQEGLQGSYFERKVKLSVK